MDDFSQAVAVMLLATTSDWCHQDLPHTTLVYAGEVPDLNEITRHELMKVSLAIAMSTARITLEVMGEDVLGDEHKVDVLLLRPTPILLGMRRKLEYWDASQYPFKPHVTVGPVGSLDEEIPGSISFDRICVGWGADRTIYRLL